MLLFCALLSKCKKKACKEPLWNKKYMQKACSLDQAMPCSHNCKNLTEDNHILIKQCLANNCKKIKHILDSAYTMGREILDNMVTKFILSKRQRASARTRVTLIYKITAF